MDWHYHKDDGPEPAKPKSYPDVAELAGLVGNRRALYCAYMRKRWPAEEEEFCASGYAAEWALMFLGGYEYGKSDERGRKALDDLYSLYKENKL